MATKISIVIESYEDMHDILLKMWKGNLITKEMYVQSMDAFEHKRFPISVPIELADTANLLTNPIVKKMFGGKIQTAANSCIRKFIEARA